MVSSFLGEDLSEVCIFQWKGDFWFCPFCGNGELSCCDELGNERGVWQELFAIFVKDSIDLTIVQGMLEVLVLCVMVEVVIELGVIDGIHIYMFVDMGKRFLEEGIMLLGISGMGRVEIL